MKRNEILMDAIGLVDEEMIVSASKARTGRKQHTTRRWFLTAAAAVACVAVAAGTLRPLEGVDLCAAAAKYPSVAACPEDPNDEAALERWSEQERTRRTLEFTAPETFYQRSTTAMLSGAEDKNLVFSPLNLYMSLALLAESTGGNTRSQIVSLLGADDSTLRQNTAQLWASNYRNDGATYCIPANSLWLNKGVDFRKPTVTMLADDYFTSVYQGDFNDPKMTQTLQNWLSEATGGLLDDAARNQELSGEGRLSLSSALYFRARWEHELNGKLNTTAAFHAPGGDVDAEYMHCSDVCTFYWDDDFTAAALPFANGGTMWFFLPDEDKSTSQLVQSGAWLDLLAAPDDWTKAKQMEVNYAVPKFDVSAETDLTQTLSALGVTDVFDAGKADFSPLLTDADGTCVTSAAHAARVTIDEEGCTAAAFTVFHATGAAISDDSVDFTLDRPFLFAVVSDVGQPLFTGVVSQP